MSWLALSSERWQSPKRAHLPRRTQVILLAGLVIAFVIFRWLQRREPWNSDDMNLFAFSVDAAAGHHWVFGVPDMGTSPAGALVPHTDHAASRIGMLPLGVPAVRMLGASAAAYYLVPLLVSLVGFCAIYWVMLTSFGPWVALVFAAIHMAWPFELEHASLFLTDLPAAVMSLSSLCLLDVSARRAPRGRMMFAMLAGLAGWGTYLLRNNGLVLLAPAYLVFLWYRPTRVQTLWAIGVALLGVLAQQAFLVYRGFGWGHDWISVRKDFADYAPFLPVYSWGGFLVRQFTYQVTTFGKGVTGLLAAFLLLSSLGLHVLLLRFERRVLPFTIAVFGLVSWLVFSFSIYERVPGGVRATVPVNFRFVQPFTYSSLVVWAWAWCSLRERLAAAGLISSAPSKPVSPLRRRLGSVALPLLLITFSLMALVVRGPETYRQGKTRRLVEAMQRHFAGGDGSLLIAGTQASLRVPRVFCCSGLSRDVEWRTLTPSEIGDLVERKEQAVVLRDVPRELTLARYQEPEARRAYRGEMARIEEGLWRDYALTYVDEKYALFAPPPSNAPAPVGVSRNGWLVPASLALEVPKLAGTPCRVVDGEDASRTLVPAQQGAQASCEHTWPSDSRVSSASELPGAEVNDSGFVLRLHADYDTPLALTVDVVQSSEHGVRRRTAQLAPGTSYVPVRLHAGARALSLVYRVKTRGAPEGQVVRIRPAEWRPHRLSPP